jgi:hypothetical protein
MREIEPLKQEFDLNLVPFLQQRHWQVSFPSLGRIYPNIHMAELPLKLHLQEPLLSLLEKDKSVVRENKSVFNVMLKRRL